jgi:hypothetical protein
MVKIEGWRVASRLRNCDGAGARRGEILLAQERNKFCLRKR